VSCASSMVPVATDRAFVAPPSAFEEQLQVPRTDVAPMALELTVEMGEARAVGIELNDLNWIGIVHDDSPAQRCGLEVGDVIYCWQGQPLRGRRLVDVIRPAARHRFDVVRTGWRLNEAGQPVGAGGSVAGASRAGVVDTAEERERRIAWIKYFVRSGDPESARALGWDGRPFLLDGEVNGDWATADERDLSTDEQTLQASEQPASSSEDEGGSPLSPDVLPTRGEAPHPSDNTDAPGRVHSNSNMLARARQAKQRGSMPAHTSSAELLQLERDGAVVSFHPMYRHNVPSPHSYGTSSSRAESPDVERLAGEPGVRHVVSTGYAAIHRSAASEVPPWGGAAPADPESSMYMYAAEAADRANHPDGELVRIAALRRNSTGALLRV